MRVPPVATNVDRAAGWAWRLLACTALVALVAVLLWFLQVIVLPTLIALTIAPALTPVAGRLRAWRFGRSAAGFALLLGLVVVSGMIAIVTTSVLEEYDELKESVGSAVDDITARLEGEPFNLSFADRTEFRSSLSESWGSISGYLATGAQVGAGLLAGVVLAVALLYFILRDGAEFWRWIVARFSPESRPTVDRAGRRAWAVLGGFVRGTALIAAIDATLIGVGLWLLGVPLAFALAVLVFLGAFVPFVGALISGLVAVLVAFADAGWEIALATLAIVVAVQFLEGNFLQPIIQSRTVDLHPAVILLAVAAGASLFGILGAYLAVPATAVAFAVVASLEAERSKVLPAPPKE